MKTFFYLIMLLTLQGCSVFWTSHPEPHNNFSQLEQWAADGLKAAEPWRTAIANEASKHGFSAVCCSDAYVLLNSPEPDAPNKMWLQFAMNGARPTATLGIGNTTIWTRNINSVRITDWQSVKAVYAFSDIGPYVEWKVPGSEAANTIRLQFTEDDTDNFISCNGNKADLIGEIIYGSSNDKWHNAGSSQLKTTFYQKITARALRFDDGTILISESIPDIGDSYAIDYYFVLCMPVSGGWKCTILRDNTVDFDNVLMAKKMRRYKESY